MRLDYTLYGLAVIFFVVTALSMIMVTEQTGKIILAASSVALGLVSASAGYFLKPKVQPIISSSGSTTDSDTSLESAIHATAEETPVTESSETDVAVTSVAESSTVIETKDDAQTESPSKTPITDETKIEPPVTFPSPASTPVPDVPTSELVEPSQETPPSTTETPGPTLTQVKGIGEKRAVQLKANGILNVDDLAKSDAATLAAKLKVSPKIVEKWIAAAKELIK